MGCAPMKRLTDARLGESMTVIERLVLLRVSASLRESFPVFQPHGYGLAMSWR
jgi:hypothetical protein